MTPGDSLRMRLRQVHQMCEGDDMWAVGYTDALHDVAIDLDVPLESLYLAYRAPSLKEAE